MRYRTAPGGARKDAPPPPRPMVTEGLDQNGAFLPSASIRLNGRTATSDANGIFRMTGVPANEGRNFLRVDKDGYFFAGRNFHVDGNGEYRVQVALAPRALVGFRLAGGTQPPWLGYPANGIEGGYQGEVKVYARLGPSPPLYRTRLRPAQKGRGRVRSPRTVDLTKWMVYGGKREAPLQGAGGFEFDDVQTMTR
ncbi:MAG: carboxypeptidase regulatory-like domain-containing protein [Flavobacteriales bacterium]|nr:carboxypeptidase regulatory-like domain-containing protein [Flavobacteriales bacterium]